MNFKKQLTCAISEKYNLKKKNHKSFYNPKSKKMLN